MTTPSPQVSRLQMLSLRLSSSLATALILGFSPTVAQTIPNSPVVGQAAVETAELQISLTQNLLEIGQISE